MLDAFEEPSALESEQSRGINAFADERLGCPARVLSEAFGRFPFTSANGRVFVHAARAQRHT